MGFEAVRAYQESLWAFGIAGNDCAVFLEGDCVYRHCAGWADVEAGIAIGRDTIFQMYSLTKPVTCAAVLRLAEQGVMRLEDPVSDYLPEYGRLSISNGDGPPTPNPAPLRVVHLMSMTSGIVYETDVPPLARLKQQNPDYTTRDFARAVAEIPLAFAPGAGWLYGWSHDVLAAAAEVATGLSFGEILKRQVFSPLGMEDAYFRVPEPLKPRVARRYAWAMGMPPSRKLPLAIPYQSGRHESGGAGLQCTVDAYAKFALALCRGATGEDSALLRQSGVALMRRNRLTDETLLADFHRFKHMAQGYGLGVFTDVGGANGPFGWGGATGAYLSIDPANALAVILAYQAEPNPREIVRPAMLERIYRALDLEAPSYWV